MWGERQNQMKEKAVCDRLIDFAAEISKKKIKIKLFIKNSIYDNDKSIGFNVKGEIRKFTIWLIQINLLVWYRWLTHTHKRNLYTKNQLLLRKICAKSTEMKS